MENPHQYPSGSPERGIVKPEVEPRAADPSIASSIAAFEANIEQAYLSRMSASRASPSDKQQKSGIWYKALMMKKDAAKQMLRAQKVIEEIEDEVAEYLTRDTIARLRSRFYKIEDESTADGEYLSAVSSVLVKSPSCPLA